jgi:hypothetical protein
MRLRKKKPKLQDEAISELAQMFIALPDDPTPGSELLDATKLDFSVNSLKTVDQHLAKIRKRKLAGDNLIKFVLRCGAYVGEVVRRHAQGKTWHWLDYEGASELSDDIVNFGKCLSTVAVLWDSKDGFCFPLGKVIKYLENGSEDSVRAFAAVMVDKAPEGC